MFLHKAKQKIKELRSWPQTCPTSVLQCDEQREPGVPELPSASSERIILVPQHSSTGAMLGTKQLMISKTEEYRDKCTQMPSKGFKTNPKDVHMVRKGYNF